MRNINMKKKTLYLVLVLVAILGTNRAKATHMEGGYFEYECLGNDSFLVTLKIFRECTGMSYPTTVDINFTNSCGDSLIAQFNGVGTEISQICPSGVSTCNGGFLKGSQEFVYQGFVVLSSFCGDWTMSWMSCCRNSPIVNLFSGANVNIKGTINNTGNYCNNSPQFGDFHVPVFCLGQEAYYNVSASEPDGDSLTYKFILPTDNSGAPVVFNSGYSYNQPISGIVLNSHTGQLKFTPGIIGTFVMAIQVCEYEYGSGILKGCVIKEFQIVVESCSNQQPSPPVSGITNFQGTGILLNSDSIWACSGDSISFDLVFTDTNLLDTISLFSNVTEVLPGAITTITNGNPAVISISWNVPAGIPPFNSFTVTSHDDNCGYVGLAISSYQVIVNSVNAGQDKYLCDGDWVDMKATGGVTYFWQAIAGDSIDTIPNSLGYNSTCQNCQFPSFSPDTTTTYVVISSSNVNCIVMDTVTVNVSPNFNITVPNDTMICPDSNYLIQVSTDQPSLSYNYRWYPIAYLDSYTLQNPRANVFEAVQYRVIATSSGGCQRVDSVLIESSPAFPSNMKIIGDTVLCLGDTLQLGVDLGNEFPDINCGTSIASCLNTSQNGIIGMGSTQNTNNAFPCVYGDSQYGAKHQMLYRSDELINMGLNIGGLINSIAFYVDTIGAAAVYEDFVIKMKCVNDTDLINGWGSNLEVVAYESLYSITSGWNVHNLATSYQWDGFSNILVEVCFKNNSQSNMNPIMAHSQTGYVSVIYQTGNNNCHIYKTLSSGGLMMSSLRPNTRFNYCNSYDSNLFTYSWSPLNNVNNPNIANPFAVPSVSGTYEVTVSDSYCYDTLDLFVDVVTQFDAGFYSQEPYCENFIQDQFTTNVGGGYFTGPFIDSNGVFYPDSAGAGNFLVTYHLDNPTLCANDSSINIEVLSVVEPTISYDEICVNSGIRELHATPAGGIWAGAGIIDSIGGLFDPTGLPFGMHEVYYTIIDSNCISIDTMDIKSHNEYDFSLTQSQIVACNNDTVDLRNYVSISPLPYTEPIITWSINLNIDSVGVLDLNALNSGLHNVIVMVSDSNGYCSKSDTIILKVRATNPPDVTSELNYCDNNEDVVINVIPKLFNPGMSFQQTSLPPLTIADTLQIFNTNNQGMFNPSVQGIGSWEIKIDFENVLGCIGTTIDTINVYPGIYNDTVLKTDTNLLAALSGHTYQWLDCDNNMSYITGAISQSFSPALSGKYAVEISNGYCSVVSDCYHFWPLGVEDNFIETGLKLYPNPTNDVLYIDKGVNAELNIEILDYTGKTIYNAILRDQITEFKMQDLASGIYFVKLSNENGSFIDKVVKY
ncbi:T9SS type A sorting domain-containing protein [bacterium SCSIO 12643]|nr:T9SS type A sorting domain-containing protein [bacterium SCSIO 12643]